jgi:hypothetical protein
MKLYQAINILLGCNTEITNSKVVSAPSKIVVGKVDSTRGLVGNRSEYELPRLISTTITTTLNVTLLRTIQYTKTMQSINTLKG